MPLSDISREILGYDVAEFPLLGDDGLESGLSEAPSPAKASPSKKSGLRGLRSSIGPQSQSRPAVMFRQSQVMRELEQLILAFDALEKFALAWDELDQYAFCLYPSVIPGQCAEQSYRNKNSPDTNFVKELKDKLHLSLDYATERVDFMCNDFLIEARDGKDAFLLTSLFVAAKLTSFRKRRGRARIHQTHLSPRTFPLLPQRTLPRRHHDHLRDPRSVPEFGHARGRQRQSDGQLLVIWPHEGARRRVGAVERGHRQRTDTEDQEETSGRSDA